MTIIDVVIATVLLVMVLAVITSVLGIGVGASKGTKAIGEVEREAFRALDRIANAVGYAGADTVLPDLSPPTGDSTISFQTLTSVAGGAETWGPLVVIEWREDPTDPEDGVDNNGNGIVDEGAVIWTQSPGEMEERISVIVRGVPNLFEGELANGSDDNGNGLVDERGLSFSLEGSLLTIRLTVMRQGSASEVATRTVETSVTLRN
jgi:hypothetical protein